MYACLALGFEGIHRTSAGGAATLQDIQRNLYETLRRVKSHESGAVAALGRPVDLPRTRRLRASRSGPSPRSPASLLLALSSSRFDPAAATARTPSDRSSCSALRPRPGISIERARLRAAAAAPDPRRAAQHSSSASALRSPRRSPRRRRAADQTANEIIISVGNVACSRAGQADVLDEFNPIAARIGDRSRRSRATSGSSAIPTTSRSGRVASRRTSSCPSSGRKPSRTLLKPGLSRPERLEVEGKGATQPIAPNETAEGRARNRRVEISFREPMSGEQERQHGAREFRASLSNGCAARLVLVAGVLALVACDLVRRAAPRLRHDAAAARVSVRVLADRVVLIVR